MDAARDGLRGGGSLAGVRLSIGGVAVPVEAALEVDGRAAKTVLHLSMRRAADLGWAARAGIAGWCAVEHRRSQFSGFDQLNAGPLPKALAGRGLVEAVLQVDGRVANTVTLHLR